MSVMAEVTTGKPNGFPASHRLHGRLAFAAVFAGQVRRSTGPLLIFGIPNDLGHARLGLSVSRRVGNAVRRNRIKRLLREAFRLGRGDRPQGYDLVIVVRPHEPLELTAYRQMLVTAACAIHRRWEKKTSTGHSDQ